jgi:hypothetical protein
VRLSTEEIREPTDIADADSTCSSMIDAPALMDAVRAGI